jgi:hypothetical protein
MSCVSQELHAYADAEKRLSTLLHTFRENIGHPGNGKQSRHAVGESANTRQNNAVSRPHGLRV